MNDVPNHVEETVRKAIDVATGWLLLCLPDEAAKELEELPAAAQEHPDLAPTRAQVLIAQKRFAQAAPIALEVVRQKPHVMLYRAIAAQALWEIDRMDEALALLEDAPPEAIREGQFTHLEACILLRMGRTEEAKTRALRALEMDPKLHESGGALGGQPFSAGARSPMPARGRTGRLRTTMRTAD